MRVCRGARVFIGESLIILRLKHWRYDVGAWDREISRFNLVIKVFTTNNS